MPQRITNLIGLVLIFVLIIFWSVNIAEEKGYHAGIQDATSIWQDSFAKGFKLGQEQAANGLWYFQFTFPYDQDVPATSP